jgi:hypothetical protein
MLTPKCPPRDFRVSARENSTKNRLYRFKWNLTGRNLAEFRGEVGTFARALRCFYINDLVWLGRQDSNLGSRDQNPLPYRLATPQFTLAD